MQETTTTRYRITRTDDETGETRTFTREYADRREAELRADWCEAADEAAGACTTYDVVPVAVEGPAPTPTHEAPARAGWLATLASECKSEAREIRQGFRARVHSTLDALPGGPRVLVAGLTAVAFFAFAPALTPAGASSCDGSIAEDGSCVGAGFYSGNPPAFDRWLAGVEAGRYSATDYTWSEHKAATREAASNPAPQEPVETGSYAAIAETVEGQGLGYGAAYWHAVAFFVGVDNDTYAAAYHAAPADVQNVMYRAAYDSTTHGAIYEDFSYDGELVAEGQPVRIHEGPAPAFGY